MTIPKPARVSALVLLIASLHAWRAEAKDKLSFQVDLKQFGYVTDAAEYSSLGFLSNDLLLVVVNQRLVYRVQPLTTDSPTSTLIVFDVAKKQMLRSAPITITKAARSVAVLTTGDFLVASDGPISRVQVHIQPGPTQYICSSDSEDKVKAGGFKVGEKVEIRERDKYLEIRGLGSKKWVKLRIVSKDVLHNL